MLTNSANAVVKDVGPIAWRLQLGSAFIPAVPLAILIFFCPESPRWLMKKGRYEKAFNSFKRLRHTEVIAARDMYYAHVQLAEENRVIQGKTYFSRLTELFTIPRVRRGTLAASTVMLAQQMCGINIIAFYSSTIFLRSGYSASQALFASLGFGAVNCKFHLSSTNRNVTDKKSFLLSQPCSQLILVSLISHHRWEQVLIYQSAEDLFFSPPSPTWLGLYLPRE